MQVKFDRRRWAHIIIHPPLRSYYAPAVFKIHWSRPPLSGANHFDPHEPVVLSELVNPMFYRVEPPHLCTSFVKPILRNYSHHSLHKTGSTLSGIWVLPFYTFFPVRENKKLFVITSGIYDVSNRYVFCSFILK